MISVKKYEEGGETGECVPHVKHVVSWTSLNELGGEVGGTEGDERGGLDDAHLNATHRDCINDLVHILHLYILISDSLSVFECWKGDGNIQNTEGLIEGALGLRESLEESRILHSVISRACWLL